MCPDKSTRQPGPPGQYADCSVEYSIVLLVSTVFGLTYTSTDIARARTLPSKLLGPSRVELVEDGKAWRIHCAANPLVLFVGDRAESLCGSGGGFPI